MTTVSELLEWLGQNVIRSQDGIAIDDGGLTLVILDKDGKPTGSYLEIGGIPER
jgi:hypothetical protein